MVCRPPPYASQAFYALEPPHELCRIFGSEGEARRAYASSYAFVCRLDRSMGRPIDRPHDHTVTRSHVYVYVYVYVCMCACVHVCTCLHAMRLEQFDLAAGDDFEGHLRYEEG